MDLLECPYGRRSGRTTWMMEHLVQAIKDGQPYAVVLAKDWLHLNALKQAFFHALDRHGLTEELVPRAERKWRYVVNECVVWFTTKQYFYDAWSRGRDTRCFGVFEDHYTAGEY